MEPSHYISMSIARGDFQCAEVSGQCGLFIESSSFGMLLWVCNPSSIVELSLEFVTDGFYKPFVPVFVYFLDESVIWQIPSRKEIIILDTREILLLSFKTEEGFDFFVNAVEGDASSYGFYLEKDCLLEHQVDSSDEANEERNKLVQESTKKPVI